MGHNYSLQDGIPANQIGGKPVETLQQLIKV